LAVSDENEGIFTQDNKHFVCKLTIEAYKQMAFLMDPFCEANIGGYQWLYDWGTTDSNIEFLFSPCGNW